MFLCVASVVLGLTPLAGADVSVSVNASTSGKTIANKFGDLVVWNASWGAVPADFRQKYPFVKTVQLMTATGGATYLDMFVDPANRTVLNDYKFDRLVDTCALLVGMGLRPYIVTGNVPLKYSANPVIGEYGINTQPPDDYTVYHNYIKALADALVARFGINEVKTWRWGVLTEYDWGTGWWSGGMDGYFRLYDHTVAALQAAIGAQNLVVGAHSCWPETALIDHCGSGINYATGRTGTQLNFRTQSFYDFMIPGGNHIHSDLGGSISTMRNRALLYGLTNLTYGVDEGRIMQGADWKPLTDRTVNLSWQGSYDTALFKRMVDSDVDWFATWGLTTGGRYGGADNIGTHIANLAFRMAGDKQMTCDVAGVPQPGNEIHAVGGYAGTSNTIHLLACNHNNDPGSTTGERCSFTLSNVAPADGSTVTVKQWLVDDNHANWWPSWWADQAAAGLSDSSYGWSKYSQTLPANLTDDAARNLWNSNEVKYIQKAKLVQTDTAEMAVISNTLTLSVSLEHHGVVFYEIANIRRTHVKGSVTRRTDGSAGAGATVWFSRAPGASSNSVVSVTADANGDYNLPRENMEAGLWYVCAGGAGYCTSSERTVTLGGADLCDISFSLTPLTVPGTNYPTSEPSAPSALNVKSISASGVSLQWVDNAGDELGFVIQRRVAGSSAWSLVATVASNATAYVDAGVNGGSTYVYRVLAYNAGGFSTVSTLTVTNTHPLPFVETFEEVPADMAHEVGPVNGQHGWASAPSGGATVQTNRVYEGQKAVALTNSWLSHTYVNGSATNVWFDLFIQTQMAAVETLFSPEQQSSVAFYFNPSGKIVAQSGAEWRTFDAFSVASNEWVRITVKLNYSARKWALYAAHAVPGGKAVRVARDLDFVAGSTNVTASRFEVTSSGDEATLLDNLAVTDEAVSGVPGHLDRGTRMLVQ
ncbi:MAG: fibronectin type III domain-containing protein [bacterium]